MGICAFVLALVLPASTLQGSDPRDLYERGLAFYNDGQYEHALELLKRASALRPNVPDYRFSLGLTYLKLGQPKKAAYELEAVRGMIGLRRNTRVKEPEVLVHLATAFIQLGKLSGARSRLELALEREPELADAHYALGVVEQKEGQQEKALERFQAVLTYDPDHPQANLALAKWLQEQGRAADAFERLRHASHGAPDSVEIQMALGAAAYEQGFLAEAQVAFRQAMELDPRNREASYSLGTVLLAEKEYAEAIEILEPLASAENPHDGAVFNLAQAYLAIEKLNEARAVLQSLAARSSEHPKVQFTLGLIFEGLGDATAAEKAYRKEIGARPDFLPAYLNLAALLEKEGRPREAIEQLRLALDQSPEAPQAEQIQAAIAAMEKSD